MKSGSSMTTYYYATNWRGDIEALYLADGSLYARYQYDECGNLIGIYNESGSQITSQTHVAYRNSLRYRSYVYDSETGFITLAAGIMTLKLIGLLMRIAWL